MPLEELTSPLGVLALAAGGLALVSLLVSLVLGFKLRRLRRAQTAVLGGHERRDLVGHATRLESGFVELRDWVEDSMRRLDEHTAAQATRVDGCVAHRALVRYDAYEEMSGQQSSSLALLDSRGSGVVISSINHRDQARVYVRQLHAGEPELQLSPEERQAVEDALATDGRAPVTAAPPDTRQSA